MEIVNHRRKVLDAMESNAKGNKNFVIKVIKSKSEGKISNLKKLWKK